MCRIPLWQDMNKSFKGLSALHAIPAAKQQISEGTICNMLRFGQWPNTFTAKKLVRNKEMLWRSKIVNDDRFTKASWSISKRGGELASKDLKRVLSIDIPFGRDTSMECLRLSHLSLGRGANVSLLIVVNKL